MISGYFRSSNASSLSSGAQLKIQKVKRLFQTFIVSVINFQNSFYRVEVDVYFIRFKWFHIVLYLCAVIFGRDIIMQFVGEDVKRLTLAPLGIFET